ncbi:MAG: sel1 repeat family protein [Clostridia bacterium]|nr:sel1 repeat family protein [Clostridia bacterium]
MLTNFDKIRLKLAVSKNDFIKAAEIICDDSKTTKPYYKMSDAFITLGNYFASENYYENNDYLNKILSLKPDSQKAILCYHLALQNANPLAVRKLERYYYYGNGVGEKNIPAMKAVYELGASLNDSYSEYKLGKLYYKGVYYEQDYEKALKHFSRSFVLNPDYSSYYLGTMYEKGLGVQKNLEKAFECYQTGAQVNAKSKLRLAQIYSTQKLANAFGIDLNLTLAEKYYREYCEFLKTKKENKYENKEEKIKQYSNIIKDMKKERLEKLKPVIKEVKKQNKTEKQQSFDLNFIPER